METTDDHADCSRGAGTPKHRLRHLAGALAACTLSSAIAAGPPAARATSETFTSKGLGYETELTALHLGDFAHARLQRLSPEFTTLFNSYIDSFSRQCASFLPPDKVAITKRQCSVESYTTNGYGVRVGPSTCVQYVDVPTGVFAAPDLYRAKVALDEQYGNEIMKNALHGGIPQATTAATDAAYDLGDDVDRLLQANACDGRGTRRLQDNLLRFATGKEGLRPPGEPTLESVLPKSPTPVGTTDAGVERMYADLVAANARGWVMNRYVAGSVEEVHVKRRDGKGQPSLAEGYYLYDNGGGRKVVGKAKLDFVDGVPRCMYFADAPGLCRFASRRVITAYERGIYENASR